MPNGSETLPPPQSDDVASPNDELFAGLLEEEREIEYKRSMDPDTPGQRIKIQINNVPLEEQTELAMSALYSFNRPPRIFSRACSLSRIRYDERNVPVVEALDKYSIRYYLARCAYFVKVSIDKKTNEWHETHFSPPMDVTYDVLASCESSFPQLVALCETPILHDDGSVAMQPGYDKTTMLYFAPTDGCQFPELPEEPSPGDVHTAVEQIKEVICDFPFVDDCSRANAIAAMITPILRPIIRGNVPMCVIDKPQAGTGASLLCDAIAIVATGQDMATITEQKTEEEWQKVITSILRSGRVLITVDNVEGKLNAPALASLLTAATHQGRILGKSEMATFPNRTVWIANGNNIQLGGDLPRRCYSVRMDAHSAQPWLRTVEYAHPDLRKWTRENRGWIVAAILTLARAWIRAGRPVPEDNPSLGSFEDWCAVVGGILHFSGIEGFLGNLDTMYENMDQDTAQWELFLLAWKECFNESEVSVADLYDHLKRETDSKEGLFKSQQLFESLPDWLSDDFQKKSSFVRRLGKALSKKDGVCFTCGLRLTRGSTKKRRAVLWKVEVWDQELLNARVEGHV